MEVSIIIPVYKRTQWLALCLDALVHQDFEGRYEIVIVDDGSPNKGEIEAIVEPFRAAAKFSLMFFRKDNGGPAAARNYGVARSSGRIVCFLDDDSVPDADWLHQVTAPFFESQATGLVSGRTVSHDRRTLLPLLLESTVYKGKCWATCNIAYRRDLFEELGGFDECFPEPSWEDNDLGLRARWRGAVHVYRDTAVVSHPHEATLDEYREKCLLNGRGVAAFCRKYLKTRPLWAFIAPVAMARRLPYGLSPAVWFRHGVSRSSVKFLWSYHSLQGFVTAMISGSRNAKNAAC